jgi:hypothetical protein
MAGAREGKKWLRMRSPGASHWQCPAHGMSLAHHLVFLHIPPPFPSLFSCLSLTLTVRSNDHQAMHRLPGQKGWP